MSECGTADTRPREQLVDEQSSGPMVDEQGRPIPDEQLVDEQLVDEQLVDEQLVDEQLVDEQLVDEQVAAQYQAQIVNISLREWWSGPSIKARPLYGSF